MLNTLQKPAVLFAPMPKSASNTLLERLEYALDAHVIKPKSGGGIGHFTINQRGLRPALRAALQKKTPLIYQHFLPTGFNKRVLQKALNIDERPKVIVLVRNIYDAVLSAERHRSQGYGPFWVSRNENEFFNSRTSNSHGYYWDSISFIKFYTAWAIAHETGEWDVKFITYDEVLSNPARCLQDILAFYGIVAPQTLVDEKLKDINSNISAKSQDDPQELPQQYKDLINNFAASFTGVDFEILGLERLSPVSKKKAG